MSYSVINQQRDSVFKQHRDFSLTCSCQVWINLLIEALVNELKEEVLMRICASYSARITHQDFSSVLCRMPFNSRASIKMTDFPSYCFTNYTV